MSDEEGNHSDYQEEEEDSETRNKTEEIEKLDFDKISFNEESHVHYLPAKFAYNGKCKVDNYFTPLINEENNPITSSLRGRKLNGLKMPVNKYNLYYTRFANIKKKIKAEKVLKIKNLTIWKYDESIENDNPFKNAERIMNELNILK
jgi:hypothetical protein